jgi:hypothetical protein
MAHLYERAGRLTAQNGGFRPGQWNRAPTPPPRRKTDDAGGGDGGGDDPCSLAGTYSAATRTCDCYAGFTVRALRSV